MDNIPKKFLNEDGTVNMDGLIKSYSELEKKMGAMVTVPGDDADADSICKFNRAIGVPDNSSDYMMNEMFDDENVRAKFHEIGLTSKQVEKINEIAEEFLSPVLSDILRASEINSSEIELEKFFGGREQMVSALREIKSFGEKFLPSDAFESLSCSAAGIQSVFKMMQSVEPSVKTDKNATQNFTEQDLKNMMRDPKYWREKDAEYVRKIENGFKKLYS